MAREADLLKTCTKVGEKVPERTAQGTWEPKAASVTNPSDFLSLSRLGAGCPVMVLICKGVPQASVSGTEST